VIVARIVCGIVVITSTWALAVVAAQLDSLFHGHPTELLLFVMVAFPVTMNTVQAWIQDQFLKWRERSACALAGAFCSICIKLHFKIPSLNGNTRARSRMIVMIKRLGGLCKSENTSTT
jgi:hypothetical protein